jgi:HD superfamily phosphohydrolase
MLEQFPRLAEVVSTLDAQLREKHPSFFGEGATHPVRHLKPYKVIHDHLWGTTRFSWRELILMDSPILQRLRHIHQTGLAYYVYPCARHSRFEHSLGVLTVASRIFDSLQQNSASDLYALLKSIDPSSEPQKESAALRQELRLAALLHDVGHSIHSHASERVYSEIGLLRSASEELTRLAGRKKGVGEVLSFCYALTPSVAELLDRAEAKLDPTGNEEFRGKINLRNVALMIIGRARHPYLQFLGDIVSSAFDADKLDYLLRDAGAAGLPLKYDLERYLYTVYLGHETLADDESYLEELYRAAGTAPERKQPVPPQEFPYYDTYRLRLPKLAMSTMEQIIICKLMLFSYIYHHQKVLSAEGLLVRLLREKVELWRAEGEDDKDLLKRFMSMTDSALDGSDFLSSGNALIAQYSYRIQNRLLPRVVFTIGNFSTHADGDLVRMFLESLQDKKGKDDRTKSKRDEVIEAFESRIGDEILKINPSIAASPKEALLVAGVWFDVPVPPKIEGLNDVLGKSPSGVTVGKMFPIERWIEAYQAHRYFVRVFAFSEHYETVYRAARVAIEAIIGVRSNEFFDVATKS